MPSMLLWKLPPQRLNARPRVQGLCVVEPQNARRGGSRREHDRDAGRVEAVIHRLGQIEARANLAANRQCGQQLGAAAAAGQLGRRERGRHDRRADVDAGRHRIAVVERAA
ncbi:MAG: hypothetical protein ABIS28_11160, partial [Caldimonas sp.]